MPSSPEKPNVIDASQVHSTPLIGKNQASTVSLLTGVQQVLGSGGEMRAFAKEQYDASTSAARAANSEAANASSPLYDKSERRWQARSSDGDRALLARAVASSQVDQMIGLNTLAEERFGVDAQGKNIGISIEVDGVQIESRWTPDAGGEKKTCALEVDYRDPRIQKGLSDLEVSDYITGQIDRHTGNIVVDPATGRVKGIDNDLAFPAVEREAMIAADGAVQQKAVMGMPQQVARETADKVLATSPDQMEQMLRSMPVPEGCDALSDASIQGAKERLEKLQAALREPDKSGITLVDQFDDKTYVRAMAVQNAQAIQSQNHSAGTPMPGFIAERGGSRQMPAAPATPEQETQMADLASDLANTPRTSYLGSVGLTQKRNDIMATLSPDTNGHRPPDTAVNAVRNSGFIQDRLQSLAEEKQQLTEKLGGYERRLQLLEEPNAGLKLRSLRYGGVEGAKEAFAGKEADARARLAEIEQEAGRLQPAAVKTGVEMPDTFKPAVVTLTDQQIDTMIANDKDRPQAWSPGSDLGPNPKRNEPRLKEFDSYSNAANNGAIAVFNQADRAAVELREIQQLEIEPRQQHIGELEAELEVLTQQHGAGSQEVKDLNEKIDQLYEEVDVYEARVETLKGTLKTETPKNRLAAVNEQFASEKQDDLNAAPKVAGPQGVAFDVDVKTHDFTPRQDHELTLTAAITADKILAGGVPDAGIDKASLGDQVKSAFNDAKPDVRVRDRRIITGSEVADVTQDMEPVIDQVNDLQTKIRTLRAGDGGPEVKDQINDLQAQQKALLTTYRDDKRSAAAAIKPESVQQTPGLEAHKPDPKAVSVKSSLRADAKVETNPQTVANAQLRQDRLNGTLEKEKTSVVGSVRDSLKKAVKTLSKEQPLELVAAETQTEYRGLRDKLKDTTLGDETKAEIQDQMARMKEINPGLEQLDRSKVGRVVHSGVRDAVKNVSSQFKH